MKVKKSRERNLVEYNSQIELRLCKKYYDLLGRMCYFSRSYLIRQIIYKRLYNNLDFEFKDADYQKVLKIFDSYDVARIKKRDFYEPKTRKLSIRLYKQDKEQLIHMSNTTVSKYINRLINDFILQIVTEGEQKKYTSELLEVLE